MISHHTCTPRITPQIRGCTQGAKGLCAHRQIHTNPNGLLAGCVQGGFQGDPRTSDLGDIDVTHKWVTSISRCHSDTTPESPLWAMVLTGLCAHRQINTNPNGLLAGCDLGGVRMGHAWMTHVRTDITRRVISVRTHDSWTCPDPTPGNHPLYSSPSSLRGFAMCT